MVKVMAGLRLRLQLSSFLFLHRDKEWFAACKRIHGFLDGYIDKAYQQLGEEQNTGKPATNAEGELRSDFLWTIARHVPEKLELRTQLTGVWIPSNETTSILMSNTLFALARHPEVVKKLREEVVAYGDKPLTFESLRSLNYLRWVENESKQRSSKLDYIRIANAPRPNRSSRLSSKLTNSACLCQGHDSSHRWWGGEQITHLLRQGGYSPLQSLSHAP